MKTKKISQVASQDANDVLETSEMLRAANCLLRAGTGVVAFANDICQSEILSETGMKKYDESVNYVFTVFRDVYAALMSRYAALNASDIGKDGNKVS